MKSLLILLITISLMTVLSSCGKGTINVPVVDATLQPYVDTFNKYAKIYGAPQAILTTLTFAPTGELSSHTLAQCNFDQGKVIVNLETWPKYSDSVHEAMIFHELGHCVLGRIEHTDTVYSDGRYTSIMNTYMITAEVYEAHRDEYIAELFNNRKN